MEQLVPVLILAAVFLLIVTLMRLGWRRRGRSQPDLPAPMHDVPLGELGESAEIGPLDAVYVTTVLADQPLERVVAHGLGARSRVRITLGSGGSWRLERNAAPSLTIPAATIELLDAAPGMVGKFIGGDGVLIVRWRLGDHLLDTGLRLAQRCDHDLLLSRKEHS